MTAHSELLRMKLDPTETMEILDVSFEEYESLCDEGYLDSEELGRGFFEPVVKFHSFWNVVECKLAKKLEIRATKRCEYLSELLDEIADLIENQDALDRGYAYDLRSIFSNWSLRIDSYEAENTRIGITGSRLASYAQHQFVAAHAKMLAFCRERMLKSMSPPLDFLGISALEEEHYISEPALVSVSDHLAIPDPYVPLFVREGISA